MARALRDPVRLQMFLQTRTFDLTQACRIEGARAAHRELTEIATASRQPMFEHFAVGWAASFAQMEGRLDEAERLAAESAVMRARMETADAESVFAAQLVMIRIAQGRLRELVEAVEHYTLEFPELAPWRAGLPIAYVAAERFDEATAELERAIAGLGDIPEDFFWLAAVILLADASAQLGTGSPPTCSTRRSPRTPGRWFSSATPAHSGPCRAGSACSRRCAATVTRPSRTWSPLSPRWRRRACAYSRRRPARTSRS